MATRIAKDIYGHDYPLADALAGVGPGWAELVEKCYNVCAKNDVTISRIEGKFGGLRFHVGSAPEWILDIIDAAEDQSLSICEKCGKPGRPRTGRGWIKTLCNNCGRDNDTQEAPKARTPAR